MANDKNFKIKNGLTAARFSGTSGTVSEDLAGGYSLSAAYSNPLFSVSSEDTDAQGLAFKSDGTKMYYLGAANDSVYQYSLSTAWDLSTASYDSVSFATTSQAGVPVDVAFGDSGTKMYICDQTTDRIYQYTLSTAWDISTASYDSKSFRFSAEMSYSRAITFKPDGTKVYIDGYSAHTTYQYTLSTAWDISTASYDSKSFNHGTQTDSAGGIAFKPDGTKFFVFGSQTDGIFEYDLSTAWDLSTASYNNQSLQFNIEQSAGLAFGRDGNEVYTVDSNENIRQYHLGYSDVSLDLSTANYFSYTTSRGTEVSFTNPPASGTAIGFLLTVTSDGSTITWPSSVKWEGGSAPSMTSGNKDVFFFITTDGGSNYYGKRVMGAVA